MNNDDFFDILGELDDELISDSAFPVETQKKRGTVKIFFLIAACIIIFIASGFILRQNQKTGNIAVYETTLPESTAFYIPEITTEAVEMTTTAETDIILTEAQTTSIHIYIPTTEKPVSQNPTTEEASEEETDTEQNITGSSPFPEDIIFPTLGASSLNEPYFIDVPAIAFFENLPVDSFNSDYYNNTEKVSWDTLEEIYGTRLVPSYIPSDTSNSNVNSLPGYDIYNKKHTVHYNEDRSEVFSSQKFVFITVSDTLTIKASTQKFPVYETEKKYMESSCLIKNIPVLLISGNILGKPAIFDALFEKDGIYFRITLQGKDLSKEEFIKIIESVI